MMRKYRLNSPFNNICVLTLQEYRG